LTAESGSARAIFWPTIVDSQSARKAARAGVIAAALVAAVTALVSLSSLAGYNVLGPPSYSPLSLIDAAVFASIAWGVHRLSRAAAVAGLALFLLERGYAVLHRGEAGGIIAIFLALWFVHGVRGTFAIRHYGAPEGPGAPSSEPPAP